MSYIESKLNKKTKLPYNYEVTFKITVVAHSKKEAIELSEEELKKLKYKASFVRIERGGVATD